MRVNYTSPNTERESKMYGIYGGTFPAVNIIIKVLTILGAVMTIPALVQVFHAKALLLMQDSPTVWLWSTVAALAIGYLLYKGTKTLGEIAAEDLVTGAWLGFEHDENGIRWKPSARIALSVLTILLATTIAVFDRYLDITAAKESFSAIAYKAKSKDNSTIHQQFQSEAGRINAQYQSDIQEAKRNTANQISAIKSEWNAKIAAHRGKNEAWATNIASNEEKMKQAEIAKANLALADKLSALQLDKNNSLKSASGSRDSDLGSISAYNQSEQLKAEQSAINASGAGFWAGNLICIVLWLSLLYRAFARTLCGIFRSVEYQEQDAPNESILGIMASGVTQRFKNCGAWVAGFIHPKRTIHAYDVRRAIDNGTVSQEFSLPSLPKIPKISMPSFFQPHQRPEPSFEIPVQEVPMDIQKIVPEEKPDMPLELHGQSDELYNRAWAKLAPEDQAMLPNFRFLGVMFDDKENMYRLNFDEGNGTVKSMTESQIISNLKTNAGIVEKAIEQNGTATEKRAKTLAKMKLLSLIRAEARA